jgi:hypothetical protein
MKRNIISTTLIVLATLWTACGLIGLGPSPPRSDSVMLGDLDGDGDLDAVVANRPGNIDYVGEPNSIWLNDGRGRFTEARQRLIGGEERGWDVTHAVALGDLDGDGDTDLVFGNAIQAPDTVWLNDGAGWFTLGGNYRFNPENEFGYSMSESVALGDLDGDGDLDAFIGNCCRNKWGVSDPDGSGSTVMEGYSDTQNMVWLNDGAGGFGDSGQLLGNAATGAVALGDLDGDGDLDAFEVNQGGRPEAMDSLPEDLVWLNDGTGRFQDSGQRLGESDGYAVALGDVDGDGDLDAFVGNGPNGRADEVWLNDGAGGFGDSGQRLGDEATRVVVLHDLDRDGDLDAFVGTATFGRIWINDGAGHFSDSGRHFGWSSDYVTDLGDLDGDGDEDVFAIRFGGDTLIWRNDGGLHYNKE